MTVIYSLESIGIKLPMSITATAPAVTESVSDVVDAPAVIVRTGGLVFQVPALVIDSNAPNVYPDILDPVEDILPGLIMVSNGPVVVEPMATVYAGSGDMRFVNLSINAMQEQAPETQVDVEDSVATIIESGPLVVSNNLFAITAGAVFDEVIFSDEETSFAAPFLPLVGSIDPEQSKFTAQYWG